MKYLDLIKSFVADEDGAVTVDWVVMTAALVGLCVAVLTSVAGGPANIARDPVAHATTEIPSRF